MAVKRIYKYGEKILSKKTAKVNYKDIKGELPSILQDMFDTMRAVKGLGLAANQIGLDLNLAILEVPNEDKVLTLVMINPVIVEKSGEICENEGCLSFPGVFARIKRYSSVTVLALNEKGFPIKIKGDGLLARAIQHEIDHLNGITFVDRLPFMTRLKLKPTLIKLKRRWRKMDESKGVPKIM